MNFFSTNGDGWGKRTRRAFTLVELVVALIMLGLLLCVFVPGLAKTGLSSKGFQCLNNNRQLCNAWRMYADESNDRIPYASWLGGSPPDPRDPYSWANDELDLSPVKRDNWDTNYDIPHRPLWPFTGKNFGVYRCPSDPIYFVIGGVPLPRVRGMSMNVFLGGFDGTNNGWPQLNTFRLFLKTTDLTAPGPSRTFVFTDERPDCINWGNYMTDMTGYPNDPAQYQFNQDFPGMFHNGGGSFSFADGSAEIHRWVDPRTTPPFYQALFTIAVPRDPDVGWLQSRATVPK